MGAGRAMENSTFVAWGSPGGGPMISVIKPHNGEPAVASNGGMTALAAKDKTQVDRLHTLALAMGGTCEGPPGPRSDSFYAAYFRDLDGNKLNAFSMG
jgi:predicted lactoylglutathione lyase